MFYYISSLVLLNMAVIAHENCLEIVHHSEDAIMIESQNLENISSFANNTEIWICSREPIILNSVVDIEDVSNISIYGYNNSTIQCPNNTEAGFRFININKLTISNIIIENCAATSTFDPTPDNNIKASIIIQHSSEVRIRNINVLNSPGTGLAMFDIDGVINVTESNFEGNGRDRTSGGSGLYLEVSEDSKVQISPLIYNFEHCRFVNNVAETGKDNNITGFSRFDKGGGICILVRSHDGVKVTINNSTISGNRALAYGGGAYTTFHNDASNSEFIVSRSNYTRNRARYGGGHYSGYLHLRSKNQTPLNCSHIFISSWFTDNFADYGGGVSVFSTKTRIINPKGYVSFENCTWRENSGQFGSAVVILPNAWNLNTNGYLPTIYFSNSVIDSNKVMDNLDSEGGLISQYTKGSGALFCTDHILEFNKYNNFMNNNGSALYLGACIANFSEHSETIFSYNSGYHGGAIYLISSALYFAENIEMIFDSNTAYGTGGAVHYRSYNFHTYSYSRTCFFSYRGNLSNMERNITIQFTNNSAGTRTGNSIYAYSLLPCCRSFRFSITGRIFDQLGTVTYHPNISAIATAASNVSITSPEISCISVLPGEEIQLPYKNRDDLGQEAKSVYLVTVENSDNSSIKVDEAYTYISSNKVLLYGNSGDQAILMLSSYQSRQRSLIINVTMLPCPPGYILSSENELNDIQCTCADGTESKYTGIEHCNIENWQANRRRGYWIGYTDNETENEDSLVTGYCPVGFCSHNDLLLPNISNREELNNIICSSRTGVMCGLCDTNHSVYYHSLHFTCRADKYCEVGWLFYILSELVPVTIIFLVIIFFNITFTSGKVNGFIFFAQVVVMFHVTAGDFIPLPNGTKVFNRILHSLYQNFNLNIFTLDELSFCLFKRATALDIIAFSYITLIYSLVLIIGVILVMNRFNMRYCCKSLGRCIGPQWQTLQGSIIHGLTAFLVLCYAKCAQASILLVCYTSIHGKGGKILSTVVFYNGDINWFSIQHLPYALPAIIMSLTLVLLPPIILIIYPLHYKIITALKLSESKCINVLLHPLYKLKPLLDSFQGSFKDEYRFFSGLYFIYRFAILVGVTLSRFEDIYFIISGILLLIILLHAVCQPYKERVHNIIDTLLFINLSVINGITMYNFSSVESNATSNHMTVILGYIQSMLIGLPFLVVILCFLKKVIFSIKLLIARKFKKENSSENEEDELPARMLYNMEDLNSSGSPYQQLK